MTKKLHNERVDGKPKTTLESGLIEAHFSSQKMASSFPFMRKTNSNPLKELEPVPKLRKGISV